MVLEHENVVSERTFNVWTDDIDWCVHCDKAQHNLVFDEQTKTTRCTKCGHIETYTDADWKILQAKKYVTTHYMPGKYFFSKLSVEEIFQRYLRELNHVDWSSWLMHDYLLAKMKQDQPIQDKLLETAKLTVEKMSYDAKPWKALFEKMDSHDPEMLLQVPQTIYEFTQKKLAEATKKENLQPILERYVTTLNGIYDYNRWKGDRVTCWITSEIIKLCNLETPPEDYTKYFSCDPLLENFQEDILSGKKRDFDLKDTYIQWELQLADRYLTEQNVFASVWSAYKALLTKLGHHAIWPPTKTVDFDITTVKKVTKLVNDPELYRFYDLATDLSAIDDKKACYYAKYFIKKVQEHLPKITSIEQEIEKTTSYIT
jgi:hypothetical protein